MKLLIMSDSHASRNFMRHCIKAVKPDALVHLGDYFEDGEIVSEENPNIIMHQVPGNCDLGRMIRFHPQMLCYDIFGVRFFMTHGHNQNVKQGLHKLLLEARAAEAKVVLYGHTHRADCHQEEDGLWVMNPGCCGTYGGSVGLIEIENGNILRCKILGSEDLEEFL